MATTKPIEVVRAAIDRWQLQSGRDKIKTADGLDLLRRVAKRVLAIPEYTERKTIMNCPEIITLMAAITRGGKWRGNPYSSKEVMDVLKLIAAERGRKDPYDALNGLPEYENYDRENRDKNG